MALPPWDPCLPAGRHKFRRLYLEKDMSRSSKAVLALLVLGACCTPAMGQGTDQPPDESSIGDGLVVIGACIGAALAAAGGGLAIARVAGRCMESMARQPEAAGAMFTPMIVTAAMIEGAMLFAILVCLKVVP